MRLPIADRGFPIAASRVVPGPGSAAPPRNTARICVTALLAAVFLGCQETPTTPARPSAQSMMRRHDRGEALLGAAVSQLADLPAAVDTQLRPPAVILDASKSANGGDVMAVAAVSPSDPGGPVNMVRVITENSRFRNLRVRSGDILKYYLLEDETVDEERREAGFANRLAMDFTVAQVIDDNTLLLEKGVPATIVDRYMQLLSEEDVPFEGPIPRGVLIPAKIEIWRNLDDRLIEINRKLAVYAERRYPPVGWQPSPDEHVLTQIVTWLNQWLRQSEPKTAWQFDPLLTTVREELRTGEALAPFLSAESLRAEWFDPYDELQAPDERTMRDAHYDGRLLQEAVWHRDISRWAQGSNFNAVARAAALFDWTVRNVQLLAADEGTAHRPWEILLYGRGTAAQRAWVFAMLARQQGLDVVMLQAEGGERSAEGQTVESNEQSAAGQTADGEERTVEGQQSSGPPPSALRPPPYWLAALAFDDQLYLFDPQLGLPIPGPGGEGVATLQQARDDEALLRQLDLEEAPYPVTLDDLKEVVPYLVADSFDLSRRARQVEAQLSGDDRLVLTSRPSELAERLKSHPGLAGAQLWEVPFRTLHDKLTRRGAARRREALAFEPFAVRPQLWKARARHFQGRRHVGEQSEEDALDDHREAAQLYTSKSVRPTDREIARTQSLGERRVESTAKLNATYWVGLLSYDDGRYDVAAHWLARPELTAADSPWSTGARYNSARTFEAQEAFDRAIELLEQGPSPQQHGNRLRARRLQAQAEQSDTSE